MAQYCRYCEFLYREKKGKYYCPMQSKHVAEKTAKHTNNCLTFQLNSIDALRKNVKGYNPTGIKPIALGGLGEQIRMNDILKGEKCNDGPEK